MKKTLSLLTIAVSLSAALSFAHAGEMEDAMTKIYCPMMASMHAQELGLSKKQAAKIQEIKDQMWAQMKPIVTKSSADTEAVLTEKQKAQYRDIMSSQACENHAGRSD
jgi:Spy/CpxP family protein refolding chaperone